MQDSWPQLKSDSTSWRKTLQNFHNLQMQWPVVSTLWQETKIHLNPKAESKRTPKLDPYWKLQPGICTVSTELRSELCLRTKTILTPGSEILTNQTSLWWIWTTMSRKFQKFSLKNMRSNWMRRILQADRRQKQKHKEESLPTPPQKTIPTRERIWTDVEPGEYSLSDYADRLQKHFPYCSHWSDDKWKKSMAGEGGNKKRHLARRWFPLLLCCSSTHCGLPPNTDDLLSVRFCCLAIVLLAPRFPSFRLDTASFRSCLSLPPGFIGTREAGICAGSRACFSPLFFTNTKDLTLKQMFDTSARSVSEQDEIFGSETIGWENHSWIFMPFIGDKESSIFNAQRSTSFRIMYGVLAKSLRTPKRTMHGKLDWRGSNHLQFTETLTESTVSHWFSSGMFHKIQYVAAGASHPQTTPGHPWTTA